MDKRSLKRFQKLLFRKRKELQEAYREKISRSGETGVDGALDSADEASANYAKEFWYSLSASDRRIMRMVDESLLLIESGEYGHCKNCSKPIQRKRLDAVPWARHCVECQDLQDRGLIE